MTTTPNRYETYTCASQYYEDMIRPFKFNLPKRIDEEIQKEELTLAQEDYRMRGKAMRILKKVEADLLKTLKEQCEQRFGNSDFPQMIDKVELSVANIIGDARIEQISRVTQILKERLQKLHKPNGSNSTPTAGDEKLIEGV